MTDQKPVTSGYITRAVPEPQQGMTVSQEYEAQMMEDYGPPDHEAASFAATNVIVNWEPQDCDEDDLNNARAYLALKAMLALCCWCKKREATESQMCLPCEQELVGQRAEVAALKAEVERLRTEGWPEMRHVLEADIRLLKAEVERLKAENLRIWRECERLAKLTASKDGKGAMVLNESARRKEQTND
jgi:uncharacterized small protein (DUF1192 family)